MLGLLELIALNDNFAQKQKTKTKTPPPLGEIIIEVKQPNGTKVWYDRDEHYIYDKSKMRGWSIEESIFATHRVKELRQMVHHDCEVYAVCR